MIQTAPSGKPAIPQLSRNEGLKASNPLLGGTIASTLADATVDHFTQDDYEFLKFHGIYQQDDRDTRKSGKHYIMMVRTKFPGGTINAEQYLASDKLATDYGNNTLRITTRQDFQFHGVLKGNLRSTINGLNKALVTTIAACGDVNRNVMAPPTPATSPLVEQVLDLAREVSSALTPKTPVYHQIWLDGVPINPSEEQNKGFVDPLYEQRYLPRKFKVAFAIPPLNDVDIFTNDVGFIAIEENGKVVGFNLLVGGGMGMTHGNAATFPRLADVLGFFAPEHLIAVAKAVIGIHRDFGDRTNRKHARLKYVLEERGADFARAEVEKRTGIKLQPARAFEFEKQGDLLGWHRQTDGNYFLGLFVENGRIQDRDGYKLKSGLRKAIEQFRPEVRLTPSQNILLANVKSEQRDAVTRLLAEHGVSVENPFTPVRLGSMACPALPTCGLSLAESERALPGIITRIEQLLDEVGLAQQEIVVRMTGCPNGCARPYMAEIAFVGRAPNKYQLYLGGNEPSTRLNRLYKDSVKTEEIINELRPLFTRFKAERQDSERFGDWVARVIWAETAQPATALAN
jgi:sulfite reductase (NADPH) hemoprotein beta-component